jgi:site-specific DNA recombinase
VLAKKLDRITRSTSDLDKLLQFFNNHNVHFVSISESIATNTARGRFMLYLLGLLAQLKREVTAERVATDMRHRASKGEWNGGVVPKSIALKDNLTKSK